MEFAPIAPFEVLPWGHITQTVWRVAAYVSTGHWLHDSFRIKHLPLNESSTQSTKNANERWTKRKAIWYILTWVMLHYVYIFVVVITAYIPARAHLFLFVGSLALHNAIRLNSANHSPSTQFMQMAAPRAARCMGPWERAGYTLTGMHGRGPHIRGTQSYKRLYLPDPWLTLGWPW